MRILHEDLEYTLNKTNEGSEKFRNSTVLITGCAGFLGYYFMRFFERHFSTLGLKSIIGVDNFMLGKPKWLEKLSSHSGFTIKKFDVINDDIANIAGAAGADYVIHLASIASPTFYRIYPMETVDANVWGLRSLLDFYSDNQQLKGFLFFSSSEIYGDPDLANIPTKEDYRGNVSVNGPRACYDEAKRFCETLCFIFNQKYGLPIGIARPFNNYGPGMKLNDKRVPADFAKAIKENADIEILSNGSPRRTFCYISDAIAGYLKILLNGKYGYFNIGISSPEITVKELADIYQRHGKDIFGYSGKIKFASSDDSDYLTHNPQRRCPDISKAEKLLDYSPEISVEVGIKRFLQFIKESEESEYLW